MAYTDEELLALPVAGKTSFTDEELLNMPSSATVPPPAGIRRSATGEIATGLKRGVIGELPRMVGQAAKWATEPASGIYRKGQQLVTAADERLARPENQLNPEGHNVVTNALASGAEMLAPSVAIPAATGLALAAAPEVAVSGAVGLGIASLAGAVPMGMAQAQDTFENVKVAGGTDESARAAGWKSGAIEAGGETVGTYLGGKLLGIGGKVLAGEGVLKPFAKQLGKTAVGEVGTEMGQSYGEAAVEKGAGVNVDPWQQAKAAIAPTLGMTALLSPFGLAGQYRNSRRARAQEVLDDTPSEDPVTDRVSGELLTTLLPEGIVLNGTKNSMANVSFPTADGQSATINIPIDEVSKLLAANKPDEIAAALEWVEQERAAKIYNKTKNLPTEDYSGVTLPGTIEDKTIRGLAQGGMRSLTTDAAKAPAEQLLAEAEEAMQRRRAELYNQTRNLPAEDYSGVEVPPSRQQPSPGLGMRFSQPPVKPDVSKTPVTGYEADLVKVADTLGNEHFVQKRELAGKGKEIARYTEDGRRTVTTIPRASLVQSQPATVNYTRLPDDPAKPDTVQYNVRGEVRTFAPAEGMSKAEVEEALAARKGPGSQVAWLQKNTVEVKDEDQQAGATQAEVKTDQAGPVEPTAAASGSGVQPPAAEIHTATGDGKAEVATTADAPRPNRKYSDEEAVKGLQYKREGHTGDMQNILDITEETVEVAQVAVKAGESLQDAYDRYVSFTRGYPDVSIEGFADIYANVGGDIGTQKSVSIGRSITENAAKAPAVEKSTPSASAKAPASPPQGVTSSEEVYNNGGTGELMLLRKRSDGLVMLQDTKDNVLGTFPDAKQAATTAKEMGYSWRDETGQLPKRSAVEKPTKAKAAKPKPAAAKPPTLPGVKYDGKNQFTITEGKAKGASFTVKDLSEQEVKKAHDKTVKGFVRSKTAPKASVVARVAARKHEMLAPTVAEIIAEDGTKEFKRVPSVEVYTALAEARRQADPKAKIDDRLFYELASMSEKDYQEVLPLDSVESEMVAFHGTPHTVDKFSMSKVGTGEGAQAYGHGLYFSSAKSVAEWYRDKLAEWQPTVEDMRDYFKPGNIVPAYGGQDRVVKFYEASDGSWTGMGEWAVEVRAVDENGNDIRGERNRIHGTTPKKNNFERITGRKASAGKLYQVDLAPAEDEYLLWDRPLSEQSEKVKAALKPVLKNLQDQYDYAASLVRGGKSQNALELTGRDLYERGLLQGGVDSNEFKGKLDDKGKSEYLHSLGIRGIKYLDGTSRGKGEGNFNYVIFNEDDISILSSEKKTLGGDPDTLEAQAIQQGLEGKTALEATKFLVDNAPTASNRIIAEKVRNVLQRLTAQGIKFNFKIAHVGDQVPASLANARGLSSTKFNETPMTVDVWLNGADVTGKSGMSYEVALHEFIHAATQAALHLGNRRAAAGTATAKAVADLYSVTNEIIAHFNARIEANKNDMGNLTALERAIYENRTNALANPHEILAWTLSNKEMQEYLETIKSGPETLWSKFVASIRTLLGLPVSSNTALAKVLAASETIFDAPVLELLQAAKTGTPATVAQTTAMSVEDVQKAAKAVWSDERIDAEIGYAAYDDGRTKAVVGFVNPKEFVASTVDEQFKARKITREAGNLDLAKLRRESQSMFLYVSEDRKIIDHEGRHRMAALAAAGIERVPVILDYRAGKMRFDSKSVNLMGQVFPMGMGKDLIVHDVTPLTFENKRKIAKMMSGDDVAVSFYQSSVESQMISSLNTAVKDARTTAANALASLNNPKDALHDKWLQHAPKVLAVTPLSHLAQTYGKTIHWIKDLAKHTNELEATTTRLIDDFFAIHEEATKAAESETGIDKFNRAMLVATFNQMNPTKELSKQDWVSDKLPPGQQIVDAQKKWVDAGMQKATGMTFTQAYAESKKEYEALGPKTQKQMVEIAKYLGKLRDMDRDASLAFIEKVSKEGSDLRKSLMEQFNNSFSRLKGMYFPLSRYGTFVLQFTGTDGRPVIEQFDSIRERKDAMLTAIANGVDEQTIVLRMQDENPAGAVAIPSELLTKLREAITTQYMTDVDKKDKEAVAAVNNQIEAALAGFNQTVLRWLPDTSALKNSMTRKSVLGANPDMLRSVNGYVQRHAGRIAWSTVGRQIEDDIAGFANENKEMAKVGDVDLTMRGHLLNNSRMWLQAVQKERVSALTSHIGKLMTGYFMTSPSTFLVQMTQLPTLTLPHLAAKYKSYGKAASAMSTALGQAFSKKFAKEAMRGDVKVNEVYDAIHRKVSHKDRTAGKAVGTDWFTQSEKLAMVGRLTDYQKQLLALREAESRNLLDISAVHEAIDVSQGNQQGMLGKAMRLAMLPMQHGELASRKAAILASFNLASTSKKDFFEAMDETADIIDKTIYNFSKRDKGWLMQKDLMRIPFTFQTYRIKTALRLGLLFRDSLRTFKNEGLEKGLADASTKEFIGIFMTTGALAGSLGVPFAGTAMGIISLLFSSDDDEPKDKKLEYTNFLTETFGQTVGDILAYGLPTVAGVNLSRRIGMGDIYGASSQPPEQLHGAGLAAWWAGNLIGPSYSIAESWVKGYDEIMNKGNYMKGLETASPKPIKDVFKAIRTATDGVKDGAGKKLLDDSQIGADEILMIALGFAPDEITRAQNAERSLRGISGRISTRRGRLIRQAAEGVIDGDASDALAEIREFNAKMPRFAIGGRDIKPAVRKILKGELGTTGRRQRDVATQFGVPVYLGE